ncbi:MAG: hypothetical protein ACLQDV_05575 [Candidatus Binataceae bacterium]
MKVLATIAILLVGCASQTSSYSRPVSELTLEQGEHDLDRSEAQCIEKTVMQSDNQMGRVVTTLGALTQLEMQTLFWERADALSQCQSNADQQKAAISERERALYQSAEARDRIVPLSVMTMSLSR